MDTSFKSCYLTGFLKPGYSKKNHKRQFGLIHIILSQNFHQSSKDNVVWHLLPSQGFCLTHIVFSRILYKFPSKVRVLFPFQASFEKLESRRIRVDPYCFNRKNRSTFIKNTHGSLLIFFSIFLENSDQETIQFDSYCHFKCLIYCLSRI